MSTLLSALSLLAFTATVVDEPPPKADTILAQLERASGDSAVRAKRKSLVISGNVTIGGMPGAGSFEEIYVGAQRVKYSVSWGGEWSMTQGTTGAFSWSTDPALGVTIKEGDEQASVQRMFAISRRDPWNALYASAHTVGKRELDLVTASSDAAPQKRAHWELSMIPKAGKPETWFVDVETSRLARVDLALPNPMGGEIPMQFHYGDYKNVGGVPYPHVKKQVVGELTIVFTATSIAHDVDVAEERIAPPPDVIEAQRNPKKRAQSMPDDPTACKVEVIESQACVTMRATVAPKDISKTLATILPEVGQYLSKVSATMAGPPFTRYHVLGAEKLEIEAGMPVRTAVVGEGNVLACELPGGRTAITWHVGGYNELQKSHKRLEEWMKAEGLEARGGPWEIYWTDPGLEPDPAKWRTQILWPVK